jgi:hypothetical protein
MNPYTFEHLIADQKFKITKSDEQIRHFFTDCIGDINNKPITERQQFKTLNR